MDKDIESVNRMCLTAGENNDNNLSMIDNKLFSKNESTLRQNGCAKNLSENEENTSRRISLNEQNLKVRFLYTPLQTRRDLNF